MQLKPDKLSELEEAAYQIRRLSVEMITYGRWGHIGGSFSMAEILAVLYFQAMQVDPQQPGWDERDRLILSKAHGSPALYAALALRGYYPLEKIYSYCELGGFEGHTDMTRTSGLESSGGPLGMGLSVAVGISLGLRFKENPRARVFCILGDGELNEGNVWEAAMAAAHYHLDNLIAIVDYNKVMAKGFVWDQMSIEPLADKWRAFGWDVFEIDGHDVPGHRRRALPGALGEAARQTHRDHRPDGQRPRGGNGRIQLQMAHPGPRFARPRTRCCASSPGATAA